MRAMRFGLRAATVALLVFKLIGLSLYVQEQNRTLVEFTAGIEAVGKNQVLFTEFAGNRARFDPIAHAASYYCLEGGNIDLGNLFAPTKQSPVRFRAGIEPAHIESFEEYSNQDLVDVVILWDRNTGPFPETIPGFVRVFERGRLRIMKRVREVRP